MSDDDTEVRIRRKAFHLWESEGRPHGRDMSHWVQAKEMVAIEDSYQDTLRPLTDRAGEPVEPRLAVENQADFPGLTDQGDSVPAPSLEVAAENADQMPMTLPPDGPGPGTAAEPDAGYAPGRRRSVASRTPAIPADKVTSDTLKGDAAGQFRGQERSAPNPGGVSSANPTVLSGDGDATQPTDKRRERGGH